MRKLYTFLKNLKEYPSLNNVNNFYFNKICLNNLKIYLNKNKNAKIILIGEAPGYKGCRNTGIPFTSEHIIINNPFNILSFDSKLGYKQTSREKLEKEITATIVWKILKEINQIPLTWNIFPFHPHKLNNKNSNRKPNKEEVEEGKKILLDFIEIFSKRNIISIGNVAHACLNNLDIKHKNVRHPSYGGKKDFELGIKRILNK